MNTKTVLISSIFISITILILFFVLSQVSEQKIIYKSILLGNLLAFINFLLGLLFIHLGINKPYNLFLQSLFAGVITRLIIFLISVFLTLKFLEINDFNYIFSLLLFYIFYIIIEVFYLILRKKQRI
jgi:hypothetical protein